MAGAGWMDRRYILQIEVSGHAERRMRIMVRFFWVIEGELAGCSRPGGAVDWRGQARTEQAIMEQLDQDVRWLRGKGIGAVLSLTETPLHPAGLAQHDLIVRHLPVPDLQAPLREEFITALWFIDAQRQAGRAVAVHCLMGQGRTGTILAAYLIRQGLSADEAIARIRHLCPGAIEMPAQEQALHAFARHRDWIV